jgi:hypothetical protein
LKLSERDFQRAKAKYLAALAKDPMDFAARNDLGLLLWNAGKRQEAFGLFLDAVKRHPNNATAHANLAFMFLRGGALAEARTLYEAALRLDPQHAESKRGLAAVLAQSGASAGDVRTAGGSDNAVSVIPYRGSGRPARILLLVSLGSGNVHIEKLLDDRTFEVTKVVVELFDPAMPLPAHDLIFNAIGDADSCGDALLAAQRLVADEPSVLNHPERVLATTRLATSERLGSVPGAIAAKVSRVARASLAQAGAPSPLEAQQFAFPLLLRAPGHHTGHHFERVDHAADLAPAAARLPGDELYLLDYIDFASPDGKYRKYRVMFVGARLYPLHLAISHHWKVHYFSAQMADYPENRAEDRAFLEDMPSTLGPQAVATLERIAQTLGLDYAGIDFALGADGKIIIFEANATMVVVDPADDERWSYRIEPVRNVTGAVRKMMLDAISWRA